MGPSYEGWNARVWIDQIAPVNLTRRFFVCGEILLLPKSLYEALDDLVVSDPPFLFHGIQYAKYLQSLNIRSDIACYDEQRPRTRADAHLLHKLETFVDEKLYSLLWHHLRWRYLVEVQESGNPIEFSGYGDPLVVNCARRFTELDVDLLG